MFSHMGQRLYGLGDGDFSFDPTNPLGVSTPSLATGNTIALSDYITGQADSAYSYSPSILNSTVSGPTTVSSSTPGWETQLTNLIPGLASTTEKILTTQYSVPQTSAGQFYSSNAATGVTTTYTLPSNSSATTLNPFSSLGSAGTLLPLLAIGALALLLFKK